MNFYKKFGTIITVVIDMECIKDFPKEMIFDKKLNYEELELIKSEYRKIVSINKTSLDNNSYQLYLDKNNNVYFPKGTLLYGCEANLNLIKFISTNGILSSEFRGINCDNGLYYSKLFYKTNRDILLTDYIKNINNSDLPFNNFNDRIAFIINPTSKIGGLLYYDLLDSKFNNNPIVKNIIDNNIKEEYSNKEYSLILVGIPSNAISGVVLGDKLLLDKDVVDRIKILFPNSYIINKDGIIIRDRSNIIKIDDFDNIAYNYTKTIVDNEVLSIENDKLKKEIKKIISTLKTNTSYFQQAKIYKSLGYKLPKGLSDKLTKEELLELKNTKN